MACNLSSKAAREKILFQGTLRNLEIVYVYLELVNFIAQLVLFVVSFLTLSKDAQWNPPAVSFSLYFHKSSKIFIQLLNSLQLRRGELRASNARVLVSS